MRLRKVQRYLLAAGGLALILVLVMLLSLAVAQGPDATLRVVRGGLTQGRDSAVAVWRRIELGLARRDQADLQLTAAADAFEFHNYGIEQQGGQGRGRVLRVGPGRDYATPSAAAAAASDGDIIEIAAGTYHGDTTMWKRNDLIIRAVGGVAHLDASDTALIQDKAIWLVRGSNIRVENIEFSHAVSRDRNGAGIRVEGDGLYVLACFFHDNETGILTNSLPQAHLRVEHSEFARNGHDDGQAHQIYVNQFAEFSARFNYIHDTHVGSAIKSRARVNRIAFNRIVDGALGSSNYAIDLSDGGTAYVVGNTIEHGPRSGNGNMIMFAAERAGRVDDELFVVHNTLVSDRHFATFVANRGAGTGYLYNNLLIGDADFAQGRVAAVGNVATKHGLLRWSNDTLGGIEGSHANRLVDEPGIVDRAQLDYRLRADSPAIDAGREIDAATAPELVPTQEYVHPCAARERVVSGLPDAGAEEFSAPAAP